MSQKDHLLIFCQREEYQSLEQAIESQCKTQWLKSLMREELPSLLELGNSEEDHQKAKEWDLRIKDYMAQRGLKTQAQQKNRLVDIRNIIQAVSPNHPVLEDIGFSPEQWRAINEKSEKVSDRLTKLIEDPEAVVSKAESLLSSRDWFDLAAALAVLTGRRCTEILKTAQFTHHSLYSVIFTGALKKQEEEIKFEIPTLTEAHKVISAIQKLREWVDTEEMDNRTINQKYAQSVINACDRHFKELIPKREDKDNLYTHLFRAVYATIAVHWYCPPKVSELEYRAYIQGHFKIMEGKSEQYKHNIAMERHYYDYKIGNGSGNIDGRLGIKLGNKGVKVLERFKGFYEPLPPQKDKKEEIAPMSAQQLDLPLESTQTLTQIQATVPTLLKNEEYPIILVGLMAVTGLKAGELIKSADFEKLEQDSSAIIYYPTLSKVKYRLPILIDSEPVYDAIARLRKHPKVQELRYLSPNQIEESCQPLINLAMKRYLPFFEVKEMKAFYDQTAGEKEEIGQETSLPYQGSHLKLSELEEIRLINMVKKTGLEVTSLLDWAEVAIELAKQRKIATPSQLSYLDESDREPIPDTPEKVEIDKKGIRDHEELLGTNRELERLFREQMQSMSELTHVMTELVQEMRQKPEKSRVSVSKETTSEVSPRTRKAAKAEEKANSAISTVMAYNDQAQSKADKWKITISVLKQLTKGSQAVIERVMKARVADLEAHHAKHELGEYQNSKGKNAPKVTEVIEWHYEG